MSNKVSAKEKRIEQLKLRLKHLNDAVKVMDESGGKMQKFSLKICAPNAYLKLQTKLM